MTEGLNVPYIVCIVNYNTISNLHWIVSCCLQSHYSSKGIDNSSLHLYGQVKGLEGVWCTWLRGGG